MKKRKLIIIGVLVLCVGGGAIFAITRNTAKASEANLDGSSVTAVTKQDLEKTIAVSGTINSAATYNVSSEIANVHITDIRVQVGDEVKAGDVLATLDDTALANNLKSAQSAAGIASQQGNLGIAEAERNYNSTVAANDTAVNRAQDALNSAVAVRDAKNQEVANAQAAYDQAKATLDAAEEDGKEAAQAALDVAAATLEGLKAEANNAIAAVNTAQQALDDANNTRNKTNADSADAVTSSKLSAASSAQSANDSVRQAKEQLGKTTLVAPADGIVTAVNAKVGDVYTGSTLIVIQDVSGFKVSATMDQYDISDVSKGLAATVTTDTTGSEKMTGSITFVSPTPAAVASLTTEGQAATTATSTGYPIEITLDNPSDRLRIGMNAKVTIVVANAKGALSIPAAAIQQDEDGSYYVEVAQDVDGNGIADSEDFQKVPVQQGLVTDYYVQISGEGIDENSFVVIPTEDVEITNTGLF
ncbi:MAG: HlyD family efflux transporter periplasmic adaptor subunit [Lachnospiraceae bacterium]|nr:HlyD family efflux transporter periplasmic adaptor subunit [Lachnospiraceae bacterium]